MLLLDTMAAGGRASRRMCSPPRDRVTFVPFILRDATVTRQQLPRQPTINAASAAIIGQFPWYYRIGAYTLGEVRDLIQNRAWQLGLGADVTMYSKPASLDLAYGKHPDSVQIFLRMRPGRSEQQHHGH